MALFRTAAWEGWSYSHRRLHTHDTLWKIAALLMGKLRKFH